MFPGEEVRVEVYLLVNLLHLQLWIQVPRDLVHILEIHAVKITQNENGHFREVMVDN